MPDNINNAAAPSHRALTIRRAADELCGAVVSLKKGGFWIPAESVNSHPWSQRACEAALVAHLRDHHQFELCPDDQREARLIEDEARCIMSRVWATGHNAHWISEKLKGAQPPQKELYCVHFQQPRSAWWRPGRRLAFAVLAESKTAAVEQLQRYGVLHEGSQPAVDLAHGFMPVAI